MLLLDFANYDNESIKERFGAPEYSYLFVRNAFKRVVSQFGEHVELQNAHEIDARYEAALARGEECVLLTFCPPNTTPLGQQCPTLPVFAWEYDTLPNEQWTNDPRENWLYVLARTGMAITHCSFSTRAVKEAMGPAFPVWTIPAPVFDRFSRAPAKAQGWRSPTSLMIDEDGLVISASDIDLSIFGPPMSSGNGIHVLRMLSFERRRAGAPPQRVDLEGVIYTAVFNPHDGRKNWETLVGAFVWAFRDTPTAILVLKLTRFDLEAGMLPVLQFLSTLGAFRCKIWLIDGLLSNETYAGLVEATSYTVNTAYGEGQCLPLMEYMSAGRPAIAAAHSAMLDYVSDANSFVVQHQPRPTHWPHDERLAVRCRHNLVSFTDLVRQYRESYRVARDDARLYQQKSEAAVEALRAFCSEAVATERFAKVIKHVQALGHVSPVAEGRA